jgi:plasmid segregation protein ParM
MTEILAIDIGFGWTKVVTLRNRLLLPSLVGPAEAIRFQSDVVNNGRGIAVEVDGQHLFVGEQAELQSASTRQTLDVSRTGSLEQKALFYAACSELVRTNDTDITVITGLPVGDFNDTNKDKLREMLLGEHTVKRPGKRARQFKVSGVHIIPQGVGSLFYLVLDRQGKLVDSDLSTGRVGIIDVGTLTTNYILSDRLRYVEVDSDSITTGTAEALRKVAKALRDTYDLDWVLQLSKVDRAVREGRIEVQGRPVEINSLVKPHFDAIAETIVAHARTLWGAGLELKAVVVTGGGSHQLVPYIAGAFPHTRTAGSDPQFSNVVGYLRAGLRRIG